MSLTNLPLTIQSVNSRQNWSNSITIGKNGSTLSLTVKDNTLTNTYWYVVLNRTSLKVELNITSKDNSNTPPALQPFLGNTNYILILSTQKLGSAYLPQGNLYSFLFQEGAGSQLRRLEQIYETLNCGTWADMAYSFVAVLGNDGGLAYESSALLNSAVLQTLELQPIDVGGNIFYTPISI